MGYVLGPLRTPQAGDDEAGIGPLLHRGYGSDCPVSGCVADGSSGARAGIERANPG